MYLDNAATTRMSRAAIDAMVACMDANYANPSSLHEAGQSAAEKLLAARQSIAQLLGADSDEIYFTSGGSEADNQALETAAAIGERIGKKHIISSAFEHHAILHTLDRLKKRGFRITLLDVHEDGIVRADELDKAITQDTVCVSIMYANNEIGTVQPIKELGAVCHKRGVLFHTDAVQAVGQLPVNVVSDNIDMLSFSAHKFHGPKGIGALYVKKGIPVYTLISGGAQERGKRAGTENLPAIIGMERALKAACLSMSENAAKIAKLRDRLIDGLLSIPHTVLNGDRTRRLHGNVNVCFEGIEGEALLLMLSDMGIAASSGSACTSGSLDPSHVLLAIGRPHEIAHGSLRLTLSHENTQEDIDYTVSAVRQVVEQLREISPVWRDLQEGKKDYVIQ